MTTPTHRIAVLLPAYNAGPDLAVTLDSLRQQTHPNTLFLVDDGSSRKPDYATLIKGMDCRLIELPRNLGITGAMNAGLAEILKDKSFDLIARIDAGDMAQPERFTRQVLFLDANSAIDIVGSAIDFRQHDAAGKLLASRIVHFPLTPEACRARLPGNSPVSHPAILVRRNVFEKLRGYSEDYPAAEDYDLMWRAARAGFAIANLPDVLLVKEENPGSISQRRRRRQIHSRMRIQWANLDMQSVAAWRGLARSLLTLALPGQAVSLLKGIVSGK
ncbi:MAG: glycosyltransferase [Hyphomicrobiales bacterium]